MHAAAEAAVGAGDDVLAADRAGKPHDPLGDQLRMLDQIGRVADHARQDHLAVRQLDVVPQLPFVLVAHVGRLERIALRLDLQHQADDVLERQVVGVRPVPASPAQVIAHAVLRNALQRMIDGSMRSSANLSRYSSTLSAGFSMSHQSTGRGRRSAG